jgi:hypothetical protein
LAGAKNRVEEGEIALFTLGDVIGEKFAIHLDTETVLHLGEFHGRFRQGDGTEQPTEAEGKKKGAVRHAYNARQTEPDSETPA